MSAAPPAASSTSLELVLGTVRELALELHGERAAQAVAPRASLEREVGLGSLERVELLLRLEARTGRALGDRLLVLDTPDDVARAIDEAAGVTSPADAHASAPMALPLLPAHELRPAATVHATLWQRALAHPDRPQVFLRDDDGSELTLTYGRLLQEARAVAGGLRERGIRRGETVALMLPTGLDFLRSFQGILVAGAVPVPIYPPVRLDRIEEYALRQAAILKDAGVRLMITVARARPVAALLKPAVPTLTHVVTAEELVGLGALWNEPEGSGSDPASSSTPRAAPAIPKAWC